MKELKLVGRLFVVVAVILFIVAGYLFYNTNKFIGQSKEASGTVVDFDYKSTSSGSVYSPVVKFETSDEQTIEWRSSVWSNRTGFKTGEKVKMLYDPQDPQKARIVTFFQLWLGTLIVTCVGLLFSLLGAGFLFMASRFRGE